MNIFTQLVKSLYSPKDIAKYRFQGIGKTILYVFFLTFIMVLPLAIYFTMAFMTNVDEFNTALKSDIPKFEIKDGTLTSDTDAPLLIKKGRFHDSIWQHWHVKLHWFEHFKRCDGRPVKE